MGTSAMVKLGCIATDPASALEFGALLANDGVRTWMGPVSHLPTAADAEALLSLLPPGSAVAEAVSACEALLSAGAARILLLSEAGFGDPSIGPVADALLRRLQSGFALVAPGFPSRGRSVYLGHLFMGTALAGEEPNLPRRLAAWADAPVGLLPFGMVEEGVGTIRREISRLAEAGRRYGVADSVTDIQLGAIAEGATALPLTVAGAGLGLVMPAALRRAGMLAEPVEKEWPAPRGAWAVLAATEARATLAQIGFARLHGPVRELDRVEDATDALEWAVPLLSDEHPVILAASPGLVRQGAGAEALAALAAALAERGVGRLLVAGEALFGPVLRALGHPVLRVGPEAAQATPWCIAEGTGLQLAFKPGGAGGRDILLRAFLPI
ncbi:four-carbon acid sugar kinase family protein [Roseomonas sp. SSH11]|uniref:Four-carbon acid sugar kinase family protein n=1 Tax=Pararoseomonas baculiformis TaxID=2820812 RepID=A0ABS4AGK9_9PROT|nr:four-carbon acid sugar kinase family protein [Pararoseomonas baculiformis]MBP0445999.1 four-carbon acid sugar kinase family protein [Pararoseomonas baculiformis]